MSFSVHAVSKIYNYKGKINRTLERIEQFKFVRENKCQYFEKKIWEYW